MAFSPQRPRALVECWRAFHMRDAFPKRFFDRQELVSLLDTQRRLQRA